MPVERPRRPYIPNLTTGYAISLSASMGGLYAIVAQVTYESGALNANLIQISNSIINDPFAFPGLGPEGYQTASIIIPALGSTYFTVHTKQASGAAQNILRARLDVYRIGL